MMKFIVAGNYKQARNYQVHSCIENKDCRIVSDPYQLRGMRGTDSELIAVGTYLDNPDMREILRIARSQEFKISYPNYRETKA